MATSWDGDDAPLAGAAGAEDQLALDDLLAAARHHLAAAAYASHLLPFETLLLAMLVEEHKQVLDLQRRLEALAAATQERDSAESS